jgi:2-polyprenyl-3-methyl-5-hydroxy-6-metoxy-1,4-benzoquinol methylase
MNVDYDPVDFWNTYCRKYGHTGWGDIIVYHYDQPLRLRSIKSAISSLNLSTRGNALDIGCGTGDVTNLLERFGFEVVGIDISQEACRIAGKRFRNDSRVQIRCIRIEEIEFKKAQFDLVTSVTVLQHVVDHEELRKAVRRIVQVLKLGGYVILMESTVNHPEEKVADASGEIFLVARSVDVWSGLMEKEGCRRERVSGYPGWGAEVSLRVARYVSALFGGGKTNSGPADTNKAMRAMFRVLRVGILASCFTYDYLLRLAVPNRLSYVKMMVFRKVDAHE